MNAVADPLPVLEATAHPVRLRLLRLLDRRELSVGELATCLDLAQSSVSRHLNVLRKAGVVEDRSVGVRTYVALVQEPDPALASLVRSVLELARTRPGDEDDLERLEQLEAALERTRAERFDELADDWDALRNELLGGQLSPGQVSALLFPGGMRVVDAGAGTGVYLPWLSELAGPDGSVVAVERSAGMLSRARDRAEGLGNVSVRFGRLEELPVEDAWADAVVFSLSLGHADDPLGVLREAVRASRPGARIAVADVVRHDDDTLVDRLGQGFRGFAPAALQSLMAEAGLVSVRRADFPVPVCASPERSNGRGRNSLPRLEPLFVVGLVPRDGAGSTPRSLTSPGGSTA